MLTGIVLAAGESSRMKQNKMRLPFRGTFLLHHTVIGLSQVCDRIIIVRGHYKDDYKSLMNEVENLKMIDNEEYRKGMFSSVLRGAQEASESDVLLIPGDYPLVKHSTYHAIATGKGLIRVPVYHNKRGHPLFLAKELIPTLLKEPISSNLKQFRNRFDIEHIVVDDPYVLLDVDDMLEYQKLLDMERME